MGDGEEGSCLVGEEKGKNMTGLMGETGEGEACFVGEEGGDGASLVGEEEGIWVGLVGDDGEGQETGVEGVLQVETTGGAEGEGVSRDKQGAAEGDVSGGEETGKEVMGRDSAEGEGET